MSKTEHEYAVERGPFTNPVPLKDTVLEEAQRLVYGERAEAYGDPRVEAERIAVGWSVILGCEVRPEHYALCMAWVKICRQVNRPGRDNLVDLAGYAGLAEKLDAS